MQIKLEYIDGFFANFTQVGKYDENELEQLGQQNDDSLALDLDALHCLRFFPHVTNLILRPGCINETDLHYLYTSPIKRLKLDYYSDSLDEYALDLSLFSNLEYVFSRTQYNFQNVKHSTNLRTLIIQEWYTCDLCDLDNDRLHTLTILSGKLKSLKGISQLRQLKNLSVSNQRSLLNIADIENCSSLESLEIESCNKLSLNTIPTMHHLRRLMIVGQQTIENCTFFFRFPKLEQLVLGVKIVDGDISYFLRLKHCSIITDHRHYNLKNANLPKIVEQT